MATVSALLFLTVSNGPTVPTTQQGEKVINVCNFHEVQ